MLSCARDQLAKLQVDDQILILDCFAMIFGEFGEGIIALFRSHLGISAIGDPFALMAGIKRPCFSLTRVLTELITTKHHIVARGVRIEADESSVLACSTEGGFDS